MKYTRNFNELTKNDAHIAGGKGASLGEMLQHHIPVPDGYVITADTFDHFIKETDLIQEINAILETVDTKAIHTVEHASEEIQALIKHSEMPQDIADEVSKQYSNHNMKYVAVRSSATSEDGSDHAWAGQLSSYLNTTSENLLEMVQNCWASLFTPRAIFYRFEKGLGTTHISVAVVVQKMVNSEKSGIAFSVHPVTEDYNQIIIEAGLGLGEAIVSGSVTPDSYVVTKEPLDIIDINVNTQSRAFYRSNILDSEHGFNEWKYLSEAQANEQVLSEEQIKELSDIIVTIENHYGFPCDIEWAFESGKFYIVQSRPITTLKPISGKEETLLEKYVNKIDGIELYNPVNNFTPLNASIGWMDKKYYSEFYQYQSNVPLFCIGDAQSSTWYITHDHFVKNTEEVVKEFFINEKLFNNRIEKYSRYKNQVRELYYNLIKNYENLNEGVLLKQVDGLLDADKYANAGGWFSIAFDQALAERIIQELGLDIRQENISIIFEKATEPIFGSFDWRNKSQVFTEIKSGINKELILKRIQYMYAGFHGLSSEKEIQGDFSNSYDQYFDLDLDKEITNHRRELEKKKDSFNNWVSEQGFTNDEKKFVAFVQLVTQTRDELRDYIGMALSVLYRVTETLLVKTDIQKESLSLLLYSEIKQGSDYLLSIRNKIKSRISGFGVLIYPDFEEFSYIDFENTRKQLQEYYLSQYGFDKSAEIHAIKGQTASRGKASGSVQIVIDIHTYDQSQFKQGDILVTSMTRPEFVPLMKKASAIVTDEGGVTSHAAIISRELNIPCVIGTKIATQVLKNNDSIEVDADSGIVKIIEK